MHAPTPHTPLQAFLADFSQLQHNYSNELLGNGFQRAPEGPKRRTAHAVQATTHYQTYPESPPGADLPPQKVCNLGPMAPRSRPKTPITLGPRSRCSDLVGPHTTPSIVNYKYMPYTPRERYFGLHHARDVNICIWSSRKSVSHETNDRVMVHGDGTSADGRRSSSCPNEDSGLARSRWAP